MKDNRLGLLRERGAHLVIVDVEATCWAEDAPSPNEIIEIGAVAYRLGQGQCDEFQTFVRPQLEPVLSPFCKDLTGIRQQNVDGAPSFPEAFDHFLCWTGDPALFTLASWGAYDHMQFRQDCALHHVPYPIERHLNLKKLCRDLLGWHKPCGMADALRRLGLPLEGTHHRGIDDARNIARIVDCMFLTLDWPDPPSA